MAQKQTKTTPKITRSRAAVSPGKMKKPAGGRSPSVACSGEVCCQTGSGAKSTKFTSQRIEIFAALERQAGLPKVRAVQIYPSHRHGLIPGSQTGYPWGWPGAAWVAHSAGPALSQPRQYNRQLGKCYQQSIRLGHIFISNQRDRDWIMAGAAQFRTCASALGRTPAGPGLNFTNLLADLHFIKPTGLAARLCIAWQLKARAAVIWGLPV